MRVYDHEIKKDALFQRIKMIQQVASLEITQSLDGIFKGSQFYEFRNGSGMEFHVFAEKCLDIASLRYKGYNLGISGLGMMFTSGLFNAGAPSTDERGTFHPPHGTIRFTSAQNSNIKQGFDDDDKYVLECSGTMIENGKNGESLSLTRRISTELGKSELLIEDTLENLRPTQTAYMLLYHCNFGWPILDADLHCKFPDGNVEPCSLEAEAALASASIITEPAKGVPELCYYRYGKPNKDGWATYKIENEKLGIGAYVSYDTATLPHLVQWKSMNSDLVYALGLEPTNSRIYGRAESIKQKSISWIAGHEKINFKVKIGCFDLNN